MKASRRSGPAAVLAAMLVAGVALASARPAWADAEAGKAKAAVCAACHGADGNSVIPTTPSLAGQPRQFIVTQLFMFRDGKRKDPQMSPFAEKLTNADLRDLADFYATQKPKRVAPAVSAEKAAAGKLVSDRNNCTSCHGANLLGQQHIPRLAGQHASYLRTQMLGFKATTRFDMDGQMTSAAQALSPEDIDILAEYMAGLEVP